MKNIIFAIIEEKGSNAKNIAINLCKEINIPLFENEIIELSAKNSNINKDIFYTIEEKNLTPLLTPSLCDYFGSLIFSPLSFIPIQDKVFIEKSKTIKNICENNSAIILSKGSNYILRNNNNCIRVLIYANENDRVKYMQKFYKDKKILKYIKKWDKSINNYYGYYTGENWDNKKCYDIFLNSSTLGINLCVKILKQVYLNYTNKN